MKCVNEILRNSGRKYSIWFNFAYSLLNCQGNGFWPKLQYNNNNSILASRPNHFDSFLWLNEFHHGRFLLIMIVFIVLSSFQIEISIWNWKSLSVTSHGHLVFNLNRNQKHTVCCKTSFDDNNDKHSHMISSLMILLVFFPGSTYIYVVFVYWIIRATQPESSEVLRQQCNKMLWCYKRFTWLIVHWNNLFQLISYQFRKNNNNHWLNIEHLAQRLGIKDNEITTAIQ